MRLNEIHKVVSFFVKTKLDCINRIDTKRNASYNDMSVFCDELYGIIQTQKKKCATLYRIGNYNTDDMFLNIFSDLVKNPITQHLTDIVNQNPMIPSIPSNNLKDAILLQWELYF